ncbi:hypothetical protein E4U43_004419 [Claviceps pusilla]|uniref:Uncharacterized protein n=1 Tax=Claviceps pusilla TaxID=123648 RepID=A0A9P7N4T8_9HYPO|nr:hypothetical protein E4U43_004419 [Claviceps pusilla]
MQYGLSVLCGETAHRATTYHDQLAMEKKEGSREMVTQRGGGSGSSSSSSSSSKADRDENKRQQAAESGGRKAEGGRREAGGRTEAYRVACRMRSAVVGGDAAGGLWRPGQEEGLSGAHSGSLGLSRARWEEGRWNSGMETSGLVRL